MRAHSEFDEMVREDISTPVYEHIERVLDLELAYIEVRRHYTPSASCFPTHPTAYSLVVVKSYEEGFVL